MAGDIKDAGNNNGLGKSRPTASLREDSRPLEKSAPPEAQSGQLHTRVEAKPPHLSATGIGAELKRATKTVSDYVSTSVRHSDPENTIIDAKFNKDLETLLGRPVRIQNDANCLAVSEATDGAGAGAHVVHAIIIGTGCGSGIAIDAKAHLGANGIGGEWGAIPVP